MRIIGLIAVVSLFMACRTTTPDSASKAVGFVANNKAYVITSNQNKNWLDVEECDVGVLDNLKIQRQIGVIRNRQEFTFGVFSVKTKLYQAEFPDEYETNGVNGTTLEPLYNDHQEVIAMRQKVNELKAQITSLKDDLRADQNCSPDFKVVPRKELSDRILITSADNANSIAFKQKVMFEIATNEIASDENMNKFQFKPETLESLTSPYVDWNYYYANPEKTPHLYKVLTGLLPLRQAQNVVPSTDQ